MEFILVDSGNIIIDRKDFDTSPPLLDPLKGRWLLDKQIVFDSSTEKLVQVPIDDSTGMVTYTVMLLSQVEMDLNNNATKQIERASTARTHRSDIDGMSYDDLTTMIAEAFPNDQKQRRILRKILTLIFTR